ncbi:alpha/beta fold hydrolase [Paenibacillus tuaregi]|uniref:alpha/beta fold hydrolase n=1 Tax=Paenibacillus tuaregi TaxID=1816681 RepID=UPI0008381834|nr:alpha/beta hydrolase [Paenibacillus tuaregi]
MKSFSKNKVQTKYGTLEYSLSGAGSPTVVLINGGSGPIEGWLRIYHDIAEMTRVVAYNRLGVGGSDKPTAPQHGRAVVSTLKELLQELHIAPPFILVGHSLGGLYANLFARLYPGQTAGVVLLDSSHPLDLSINTAQGPIIRGINKLLGAFDAFPAHRKWNEVHYVEETAEQIAKAGAFPQVPLFVVSGGKKPPFMPESAFEIRRINQRDFLKLSGQSTHLIAAGSGHFPQFSEPDIVTKAITECIKQARADLSV